MRSPRPGIAGLLAACLLALGASTGEAGWSYELWNELMSPFCPGRTLADCPSEQAEALRTWIVRQEEAGQPRAQVEASLEEQYGNVLRQAPSPTGFGITAYAIPAALFLAGGAIVALFLRRQSRAAAAARPAAAEPDPDLERRVDEDLRDLAG
jgi:cytochrome c-type biogenesis protein CcmH/NrfF